MLWLLIVQLFIVHQYRVRLCVNVYTSLLIVDVVIMGRQLNNKAIRSLMKIVSMTSIHNIGCT